MLLVLLLQWTIPKLKTPFPNLADIYSFSFGTAKVDIIFDYANFFVIIFYFFFNLLTDKSIYYY